MNDNKKTTEKFKELLEKAPTVQVTLTKTSGEKITFQGNGLIGTLFNDQADNNTEITQIAFGALSTQKLAHASKIISDTFLKML